MSNKRQLWETMSTQLAQATDVLERNIDSGIFETVVVTPTSWVYPFPRPKAPVIHPWG